MLKTLMKLAILLMIALGGGIWSTNAILNRFDGFGELRVGLWSAHPDAGTEVADPYAKARAAQKAVLPLGTAEGLVFQASFDNQGRPLQRNCAYRLSGFTPPARFWTLYAASPDHSPITIREGLPIALHSRDVVYESDGSVLIHIGADAHSGNWLPLEGQGDLVLVMTLYDTPAASSAGLVNLVMPQLQLSPTHALRGCDA